ncbi:MAG: hypothetical protein Q9225_004015 [Loekoesia sp. 1 TL-2023]
MSDLKARLLSFGMGQYYPSFAEAGFGTWETILDITEDDLDSLGVQRGHRRRLQQEIAFYLASGAEPEDQTSRALSRSAPNTEGSSAHTSRKRQYTRHPKPDSNAPQRPPSAYLLFSNAVRDKLRDESLSFAEKSKIVGDQWQNMPDAVKNQWRQTASGPWEKYKSDQMQYQNTDSHRDYQAYLAEFDASHPSKKRKAPSKDQSTLVDGAASDPRPKHSPSSDVQPSSATRTLAPAPGYPAPDHAMPSSPTSAASRRRKPVSDRRDTSSPSLPAQGKPSQVFSHACESCRKKKVKCNGATPSCERCLKTSTECHYAGGIRDREKRYNPDPYQDKPVHSYVTRLVEEVVDKLNTWEEAMRRMKPQLEGDNQNEIDRLLSMSPQMLKSSKMSPGQASDDSESDGGESDVSNVGSMGSTDHFNEESYKAETGAGRIDAFLGQTATDNWVDRLQNNLNISDQDDPQDEDRSFNVGLTGSYNFGGSSQTVTPMLNSGPLEEPAFGEHSEPYELPMKASADSFVATYFSTVHPSFPIISRAEFLRNYEEFFASSIPVKPSDSAFMPMLHLVLAIGAIHAYVTRAPWVRDERSYLWNFARAKAIVLDTYVLRAKALEQVQLCGLGGLYYLITYEVNKQRDLRLSIWFSVLTLERTMTIITGRPSMIRDMDCSVILPDDGAIDPDKHLQRPTSRANLETRKTIERPSLEASSGQTWARQSTSVGTVDPTFFLHHTQLSSIANLVLTRLYSPHVRHTKWSELQLTIRELNRMLHEWNSNLSRAYETDSTCSTPETDLVRIAIGMLFHSTRIIINRPCHCRLERRIADQSSTSKSFNVDSAGQCVASALGILTLIPNQPDPTFIYQGPLWWMCFHHLKRAATVLILEITFLSENAPSKGQSVLGDAKKAINWLHAMGASSKPAYSSWATLSRLLHRAAQRFGGDLSDVAIAEAERKEDSSSSAATSGFAVQGDLGQQVPSSIFQMDGLDGQDFPLGGLGEQTLGNDLLGGMDFSAWDQFPLSQAPGDFYPSW